MAACVARYAAPSPARSRPEFRTTAAPRRRGRNCDPKDERGRTAPVVWARCAPPLPSPCGEPPKPSPSFNQARRDGAMRGAENAEGASSDPDLTAGQSCTHLPRLHAAVRPSALLGSLSLACLWAVDARAALGAGPGKIRHVIVIMQENHSFDNYFGTFPGVNGIPPEVCVPDPAAKTC